MSSFMPLPGKLATTLMSSRFSSFNPSGERLTPKKNSTGSGENFCNTVENPTVGSADTFYAKLVSGEAELVHAWDGWCNYGIAENEAIKYVIPQEGSDLWVDTMVILKNSENKEAAYAFVNFILDAKNHGWAAENILYKVPNKPAMESLSAEFLESFPNMAISAEQLLTYEQLRDVGEAQRLYARTVSEIKAAQ